MQRDHERRFDDLTSHLDHVISRLKADFPFYSPRYLAHMLSEQTLPSVLGYFAGMLYNPNNVTDEAAPVTVRLEIEAGRMIATMLGYKAKRAWAHITSGGSVATVEALWVARTAQFVPLALRDLARRLGTDFPIKLPSGQQVRLRDVDDLSQLLRLRPNEGIFMPRKLARHLVEEGRTASVSRTIREAIAKSDYNPGQRGIHAVMKSVGLKPVILAPASSHYCIRKACNVLGYGESALRLIPVTRRFRVNVEELAEAIRSLHRDEYIAAVIGVVGTTEEGAVDPIHQLHFLREELAKQEISFWLHVDAAWGGYVASLFRGHVIEEREQGNLDAVVHDYVQAIGASEQVAMGMGPGDRRISRIHWDDSEVYKAFLALADADSIVVDPHKLGYIPYPAGAVAFRNGLVTELLTQKANYIAESARGDIAIDEPGAIKAVGPYILEGSKPGAAAVACWLAHTAIPLVATGHGRLIRASVLNATRLHLYLLLHKRLYFRFEKEIDVGARPLNGPRDRLAPSEPFTLHPIHRPDTNVICFIVRPMAQHQGRLVPVDVPLERLNKINEGIHGEMAKPSGEGASGGPYGHPFFVSRTMLESDQYSADSIAAILDELGIDAGDYRKHGLFVLRSTVMNPHYLLALRGGSATLGEASGSSSGTLEEGKDYLFEFVRHLHLVARRVLERRA